MIVSRETRMPRIVEAIGAATADLDLHARVIQTLAQHWALVLDWNQHTNLTSITDHHEAAWLHYRDSLEALKVLPPGDVTDLGSGAGFPGLPIAIASPRSVTLVEPRRKRASFLEAARARLGLSSARVLHGRVEDTPVPTSFVVTRATFSNPEQITYCMRWVQPGGWLVAFRTDVVPADRVHPYLLRGEQRYLLIWQC